MLTDFPINYEFYYDENNDEWIKSSYGGEFILYRTFSSYNTWSLSFVDIEEDQHFLIESDNLIIRPLTEKDATAWLTQLSGNPTRGRRKI